MKTFASKPFILGCIGLAISSSLVSCVDPYAYGPTTTSTVTTYRTGYEVQTLPSGYRTEVIAGDPYYVYNGTYFRPRSGRYVVVEAPRGGRYYDTRYDRRSPYDRTVTRERVITHLPSGYRVVTHRGNRYYQVRDVYYQQRGSGYVIVQAPF
jgi:hypothetical protein